MWPNDVVLDYKITIQYGVHWLCTTSISLSFEDSEKALNSDSLDVLFCLRNHSYWSILFTPLRNKIKLHNKFVPVSWPFLAKRWAVFSAKITTKFLFWGTLTFTINLFTYWAVKLCQKVFCFTCTLKTIIALNIIQIIVFYGKDQQVLITINVSNQI